MPLPAQVTTITIPAGSPEDVALQQIANEPDVSRRNEQLKDFTQKFASDPQAVAYGYWQLAQNLSSANHYAESLAYGDKAVALQPHNMEILMMQATTAQQLKHNAKVFEYSTRGGESFNGIGQDPKPASMADQQYESQNNDDRRASTPAYEYLQAMAYNVIAGEGDAKARMSYIQRFNSAFPDSKYQDQVSEFAILTLQSLDDTSSAVAYGEAVLAQNPKNLPTLVMMANAYIESPKSNLEKGIEYARRAIDLAQADAPNAETRNKLSAGLAYRAIGNAMVKQEKLTAAVPELKHSAALLRSNPAEAEPVLYNLGRVYARMARYEEAKEVLREAINLPGPAQPMARDLLTKIVAARH